MPAPGFTPIIIYHSNTAAAVPSTGNLTTGELAVNVTDKKIYTKSAGGSLVTLTDTMASQAANAVAITGGTIQTAAISSCTINSTTITGGSINAATIGNVTPAAGSFTSVSALTATILGGTINNSVIGGVTPAAGTFTAITASLDSAFTSTGALQIPVGTSAQQPTGATGKIRYNTSLSKYEGYNGSVWTNLGGGATGGGTDEVFIENKQTVTTNYSIPSGKSAMSTGPITINAGITVTVPAGSRWVIL